jgi:hypothetical protein
MTHHDVLLALFIGAIWAGVNVKSYISPRFRVVLGSEAIVAALFGLADVTFCYGLLDVVQSLTPPPVSWFEKLSPAIPTNVWGIYVLVLKKAGYDALLYIGSTL